MIDKTKAVLFVGRFQPLHYGHISVIEWLRQQGIITIVIGIGSSQYQSTVDNPLSFTVRQRFWQTLFPLPEMPVVALPDIHDDARWIEHITKLVYDATSLQFQAIITNNPWVERLAVAAHIPVLNPPQTIDASGTMIRQLIRQHDTTWKQYVPDGIHQLIESQDSAFKAGA